MENKTLTPKRKKGKYGYVNENGEWIIEPIYQVAWDFKEGIGRIKTPPRFTGKYGFIKSDGKYLIAPQFDSARDFKHGFAAVAINNKWTFLKPDGTFLTPFLFEKVWDFKDGKALVKDLEGFHFLLPDGSFKVLSGNEDYILKCCSFQNKNDEGWSFLDIEKADGKWKFKSWRRQMDENQDWYDHKEPGDGELTEILRYIDKIGENLTFAEWANTLDLSTSKEVGQLLCANVEALLWDTTMEQKQGQWLAPLRDITILLELCNQIQVIEKLNLEMGKDYGCAKEIERFRLTSKNIKEKGMQLCERNMLFDEDGFFDLDFNEFLKLSYKPGEYIHSSEINSEEEC